MTTQEIAAKLTPKLIDWLIYEWHDGAWVCPETFITLGIAERRTDAEGIVTYYLTETGRDVSAYIEAAAAQALELV